MSKFSENRITSAERRQMLWEAKKEKAKFYKDLAKLAFGGLIVSEVIKFHEGSINWYVIILGVTATFGFNILANRILKLE